METARKLLIAVDAGHGGYDNGASWMGRVEKDDNLRLAQEVQRQLSAQGLDVLMTRPADEFVSLQDRARMANEARADLFVSLHRNSYTEQTPSTKGVENFIYLTASESTSGRAARLVLDQVVDVGVQDNRGVKRGNYYVLRKTTMPAMLLEMGYIINDIDNQLFDENLVQYAAAIVRGVMEYFDVPYNASAGPDTPVPPIGTLPEPEVPVPPIGVVPEIPVPPIGSISEREQRIRTGQQALNDSFGSGIVVTGVYDLATRAAATRALQTELNGAFDSGLTVDGLPGPKTRAAIPNMGMGSRGSIVLILQILLLLQGYDPGPLDGIYGSRTSSAVYAYQRDHYLAADGIAGPVTVISMLTL